MSEKKELTKEEQQAIRRNEALIRQAKLREQAAREWDLSDGLKRAYECPEVRD